MGNGLRELRFEHTLVSELQQKVARVRILKYSH